MIIHTTRASCVMIDKFRHASLTRTIVSSIARTNVSQQHVSFSSMARHNVHVPLHTYTPPPPQLSLPPFHRSPRTDESDRKIRDIQDFVDRIPAAVKLRKTANIEPGAFNDPVARLFRRTELPSHVWKKYSLFDSNKPYTRNLISTDHETYTLLLLCWNPNKESPIHDHPCDGCWLQVLQGGIRENRYDRQLNCISQIDYREGQLSYITDNVGYHKVGNPTQRPSVTLHLYAPPFETCQCWHSEQATPTQGKNINHSEYGILKVT